MEVTRLEQLLIDGLKTFPLPKWCRALIFIKMDTDEKKIEMMQYMATHREATEEQLMEQAVRISGE